MAFTQREKYIGFAVAGAAALFAADRLALTPYLEAREDVRVKTTGAQTEIAKISSLFREQRRLKTVWKEMNEQGLKSEPQEADSQVYHALQIWAVEARVNLEAITTQRSPPVQGGQFVQISFTATATGPMAALAEMVWRVETAQFPVRVTSLQIAPQKEARDDLKMQLTVSTLCALPNRAPTPGRPGAAGAAGK